MTEANTFPKRVTVYLHGHKEQNWDTGTQIGLSEEAIRNNFAYACYEVGIDLSVNEDGTYQIIGVEGALLQTTD